MSRTFPVFSTGNGRQRTSCHTTLISIALHPRYCVCSPYIFLVEHVRRVGDFVPLPPPADVPIESECLVEHARHIGDVVDRPSADILIESLCIVEHVRHIRDAPSLPPSDVLVEG